MVVARFLDVPSKTFFPRLWLYLAPDATDSGDNVPIRYKPSKNNFTQIFQ